MHVGDARQTLPSFLDAGGGTPRFGYLFFDAEHTHAFGDWIGRELLRKQAALAGAPPGGTPSSIHDVFHNWRPSEEGYAAFAAMRDGGEATAAAWKRMRATTFTAAKCRLGLRSWRGLLLARKRAMRHVMGAGASALAMHPSATSNPTVFFYV